MIAKIKQLWRDFWRGYSDRDMEWARALIADRSYRAPGKFIPATMRQMRALDVAIGEGVEADYRWSMRLLKESQ